MYLTKTLILALFYTIIIAISNPSSAQEFKVGPLPEREMDEADEEDIEMDHPRAKLVTINPGHGGVDLGSRSSKSILEKNINLRLARLIEKRFSLNDDIEVRLTRSEDRAIDAFKRIEFANSSKSDIYISIHSDGGMGPRKSVARLFINKPLMGKKIVSWKNSNDGFDKENHILAEKLTERLNVVVGREIKTIQTDLLFLGGLAMPAVIVEAVDLSNPEDEIRLEQEKYLTKLADAMTNAIIDYFTSIETE